MSLRFVEDSCLDIEQVLIRLQQKPPSYYTSHSSTHSYPAPGMDGMSFDLYSILHEVGGHVVKDAVDWSRIMVILESLTFAKRDMENAMQLGRRFPATNRMRRTKQMDTTQSTFRVPQTTAEAGAAAQGRLRMSNAMPAT